MNLMKKIRRPRMIAVAMLGILALVAGFTVVSGATSAAPAFAAGPGAYQNIVAWSSGQCVDVQAQWVTDGANVQQWTCVGTENQQWSLIPTGDGYYYIVARHSGKCLDVYAVWVTDGANVQQWTCVANSNQQWRLDPIPPVDGVAGYFIVARHSQKCLDLYYAQTGDGVNIQQMQCNGGSAQKWRLA